MFTDRRSGVRDDRPGLTELLNYVRAGDTVVVIALDRLGRALSGVIRTVERLTEGGVLLRSLRGGHQLLHPPTGRTVRSYGVSRAVIYRAIHATEPVPTANAGR